MSIIHEKSPKHCAEKQATYKSKKKLLVYVSSMFFLSLLSLILLLWLILHPNNPQFSLTQAKPSINSSIHLTLLSTNPNKRIGIYYDRFILHASNNSHLITQIPPFFQDHHQTNILSVSLPLDPSLAYQLRRDQAAGKLPLGVTAAGSLRWKVGDWISWRFRFNVDCVTVLPFGRNASAPLDCKQAALCSPSIGRL